MRKLKRWLCLVLALSLTSTMALPAGAADPLAQSFAVFLIDADDVDHPEKNLHVDIFRRNESGVFDVDDSVWYTCRVNRAAGDTLFYIRPNTNGVWVEVDYLTDLDGMEGYEMLDGEDVSASDIMTTAGTLEARSSVDTPQNSKSHALTAGRTYTLSAAALAAAGQAALEARRTPGSGQEVAIRTCADRPLLYYVSLHYFSEADQMEYTMGYYLSLYEGAIVPSDVVPGAWYYDAVEYALSQGLFTGTEEDAFSPFGAVTRGQLAQILWRLGGSKAAEDAGFADVSPSDWYYAAVCWCKQEGLMAGGEVGFEPGNPLTREQLALVLRQYARYAGTDTGAGRSLDGFADGADASSWAREGLEWAVGQGLLSGYDDNTLRPVRGITRCELAAVLRSFCQNILEL